jgi:predicted amidohydrolase
MHGTAESCPKYFLQRDKTSPLCYLVLPEMCCTGYCFTSRKQIQSLVEPVQVRMLNTLDNQTPTTGTLSLSLSLSLSRVRPYLGVVSLLGNINVMFPQDFQR